MMRAASCNLTKKRLSKIVDSVILLHGVNARTVEAMGHSHAPLDLEYTEIILGSKRMEEKYPFLREGLTGKQIQLVWAAVKLELEYRDCLKRF